MPIQQLDGSAVDHLYTAKPTSPSIAPKNRQLVTRRWHTCRLASIKWRRTIHGSHTMNCLDRCARNQLGELGMFIAVCRSDMSACLLKLALKVQIHRGVKMYCRIPD